MYLLDTDVLSNLMRPVPSTILITRIASVPLEFQYTSSISLGELVYGAFRRPQHTETLLRRIEQSLLVDLPLLPFDAAAAHRYGEIRAHLERAGTPIGDADVRVASIALTRGFTVVTGNVRHFGRVPGLEVENWME